MKSLRNKRIEAMIRSNLHGDLVAQVLTLGVCIWWLKSPWMWAVWCVRWIVVGAIVIALRAIVADRQVAALRWLSGGHIVGVFGLVIIVPVLAPLAMLILAGDLFLASYLDSNSRTRFFRTIVVAIAGIALFRFQNWTHLSDLATFRVAVFAIITNTFASGVVIPRTHRQHYNQLCELRDRLGATEQRLSSAIAAERLVVSRALNDAPIAHLKQLTNQLETIRTIRDSDVSMAVAIADQAVTGAQDALRSVRTISRGVFPELLQFGLSNAIQPLLQSVGTVERLEIPETRFPAAIEAAVYVVIREWCALSRGPNSLLSIVLQPTAEHLRLTIRVNETTIDSATTLSPLATDRIAAIGGESLSRFDSSGGVFEALIPINEGSEHTNDEIVDANQHILGAFARWGISIAGVGLVCSLCVLIITRTSSSVAVAGAMAWLTLGVLATHICIRRSRYGLSVGLICVVSSTSSLLLTALLPELTPVMALVVSFPLMLSLPYFSKRVLDLVVIVQAAALTAISVIGYLNRPLVRTVVPVAFPALVVPIAAACVGAMIAVTMTDTVRAVTDGSVRMQQALRLIVHEADAHRQTIERDLHDGAQQMFVAISLQFRTLSRLLRTDPNRATDVIETVAELLQSANDSLDSVARGTLVPELETGRIGDALRAATAVAGCPTKLTLATGELLPPEVARVVYFCCHEALQNAVKHGGPGVTVNITVRSSDAGIFFTVADTGQGFNLEQLPQTGGLQSLIRRISTAGGTLSVASSPGKGTTVAGTVGLPESLVRHN